MSISSESIEVKSKKRKKKEFLDIHTLFGDNSYKITKEACLKLFLRAIWIYSTRNRKREKIVGLLLLSRLEKTSEK
jgi:hypothetical protein